MSAPALARTPMPSGASVPRRRRRRPLGARLAPAVFMSPWVIGFLGFILYPMVATLYFSFTKYNLLQPPQWVGLFNYRFMFTSDPRFWQAVRNTVWIIGVGTTTQIVFAIAAAMVLTRVRAGSGVYRTVFFVPTMVPAVAGALAFVFLLHPSGPVNAILALLHLPRPLWFQDPTWSKPALVLLGLWGIGDTMIIFFAAMLDVPVHLYEAADIEGAGGSQKFRYITLPMISPVIFFAIVIGTITGFQYFAEAYVASGGSAETLGQPNGSLMFYSSWLYNQGFEYSHMGYAAAMAWVLFVIVMICTLILIRTSRRWVHYQGGFR
jgi:multiple sugar transport system permease protein